MLGTFFVIVIEQQFSNSLEVYQRFVYEKIGVDGQDFLKESLPMPPVLVT